MNYDALNWASRRHPSRDTVSSGSTVSASSQLVAGAIGFLTSADRSREPDWELELEPGAGWGGRPCTSASRAPLAPLPTRACGSPLSALLPSRTASELSAALGAAGAGPLLMSPGCWARPGKQLRRPRAAELCRELRPHTGVACGFCGWAGARGPPRPPATAVPVDPGRGALRSVGRLAQSSFLWS